jgi:hypothetical protein
MPPAEPLRLMATQQVIQEIVQPLQPTAPLLFNARKYASEVYSLNLCPLEHW